MNLKGVKIEQVEIVYDGTYSDLINQIFNDIFGVSIKNVENLEIEEDKILFQHNISPHGSPMWETFKEINKNDDEQLFNLANELYLVYNNLLKYEMIGD